jgi:hypothetical protein
MDQRRPVRPTVPVENLEMSANTGIILRTGSHDLPERAPTSRFLVSAFRNMNILSEQLRDLIGHLISQTQIQFATRLVKPVICVLGRYGPKRRSLLIRRMR